MAFFFFSLARDSAEGNPGLVLKPIRNASTDLLKYSLTLPLHSTGIISLKERTH